jgi:hypothetical protein
MQDLIYVLYANTEYDDILKIHLKKLLEFFPSIPYCICINDKDYFNTKYGSIYKPLNVYEYDNSATFTERIRSCISTITSKYILFIRETEVLTNNVNYNNLNILMNAIKEKDIDQLRLYVSGIPYPVLNEEVIHEINEGYFMSLATAIWKREKFLQILTKYKHLSYKEIEGDEVQNETKKLKNYYIAIPNDPIFLKEGVSLSFIFPVIHLTFRGKWWYTNNHKPFIDKLLSEFNIDINTRGAYYEDDFINQ